MAYGSEVKPSEIIAPLLASYALWPHFKRILENGSDPPRARLDEASRQLALEAALLQGNHKSAKKDEGGLAALLIDDVTRGYSLPLPLDQVLNIPGLSLQPMRVTIQNTINAQNEIVSKKRLTHDSTFEVLDGIPSYNKRIKMEDLVACHFGWALLRIMYLVVSLVNETRRPLFTHKRSIGPRPTVANTTWQARRWNAQPSAATYCSFHSVLHLAVLQTRPNSATAARPYAILQTSSSIAKTGTPARSILRSRVRSLPLSSLWIRRSLSPNPSRLLSTSPPSRSAKRISSSTTSLSLFQAIPATSVAAMPQPPWLLNSSAVRHMRKNPFSVANWLLSANFLPKGDWKKLKQSWGRPSTPVACSCLYQKTSTKNGRQIS
jgi:hypothetical protein